MSLKTYLEKHKTAKQIIYFTIIGQISLFTMLISRLIFDLLLKNLTNQVNINPFPPQALGSFLAFLISNILCKTVSYILNRKKTFNADSNAIFGAVVYTVMVILLIVVETIIGTPVQNWYYKLFGGKWTGSALNTASVLRPALYQVCGSLTIITCGIVDSTIVFFMEKFVIMKSSNHSNSKTPV